MQKLQDEAQLISNHIQQSEEQNDKVGQQVKANQKKVGYIM